MNMILNTTGLYAIRHYCSESVLDVVEATSPTDALNRYRDENDLGGTCQPGLGGSYYLHSEESGDYTARMVVA